MKVFVTGGTGFIGRRLVDSLLKRGWHVTVLARQPNSTEASALRVAGAEVVKGDITIRSSLPGPMRGADIVIHNAGWYTFGVAGKAREEMKSINVRGAENVLGTAAELGVPRIVHVSSIVAHGPTGERMEDETFRSSARPQTIYEVTKIAAHDVALRLREQGAPVMIASPSGVVGPGDHSTLGYFARLYLRGFGIPLMSRGRRSTVYVDDCAEGIALVAEKGRLGEEYILSGGVSDYKDMVKTWHAFPGGPKFTIWLPRGIGDVMTASMEPFERLLRLPVIISREVFLTGMVKWNYSGEKAVRELGAFMRDPETAWRDTMVGEMERMKAGRSWRDIRQDPAPLPVTGHKV